MSTKARWESHVGLGTGSLGSDLSHRESCRLVEAAVECGFRYFDTAPPYGHGEAERILGEVLSSIRAQVTLVTKVGIRHPVGSSALRTVKRVLLPLKSRLPGVWKAGASRARAATASRGRFSRDDVLSSVEESLRRLKTDRLDVLLLHGARPDDVNAELMECLRELRRSRVVGGLGLGSSIGPTLEILRKWPGQFDTVQCNHYWAAFDGRIDTEYRVNTHRCVQTGLQIIDTPEFREAVLRVPAAQEALQDPTTRGDMLLRAGLRARRDIRVIVATAKVTRLQTVARIASAEQSDPAADSLNGLFRGLALRMDSPEP